MKKLTDYKLLFFMHYLLDCLSLLSTFSLKLQDDSVTLYDAVDALETVCLELVNVSVIDAEHVTAFKKHVKLPEGTFKGIQLNGLPDEDPDVAAAQEETLTREKQALARNIIDHVHNRCGDIDTGSELLQKM